MTIFTSEHGKIVVLPLSLGKLRIASDVIGAIGRLKAAVKGSDEVEVRYSEYSYLEEDLANEDSASLLGKHSPEDTHALLGTLADKLGELQDLEEATGELPAVYTYFGQFLNHDISAPLGIVKGGFEIPQGTVGLVSDQDSGALAKPGRPGSVADVLDSVVNQHRWPMTLHSLYGDGPFEEDENGKTSEFYEPGKAKFRLGETIRLPDDILAEIFEDPSKAVFEDGAVDLPRDPARRIALIADRRNDENLIISQLHLAFILFHNNAVDALRATTYDKADEKALFEEARRLTVLHYQWCIVHDYLKNLLDGDIYKRALSDTKTYPARDTVPMEFAAAIFRFGHSMVSSKYNFNENFWFKDVDNQGPGGGADLGHMFDFTSKAGMNKQKALPNHWIADWGMLTGVSSTAVSKADRIDAFLVGLMLGLPGDQPIDVASIARTNLWRGYHRRIPSGQALADAMKVSRLTPKEIADAVADGNGLDVFLRDNGLDIETPAWLYTLCEARVRAQGNRLGPMGSTVVAKTIFGLLRANPDSVLCVKDGKWRPDAGSPLRTPDKKPVADIRNFLQFAGVM
jgi:hypothetical protein